MEMMLKRRNIARNLLKPLHGHDAHLRILNGLGLTRVKIRLYTVQSNHIARHLKARDLVSTVVGVDNGLKKTHPDRVNGGKRVALTNQGLAFFHRLSQLYQFVNFDNVLRTQSNGQTKLAQIATRASKLQMIGIDQRELWCAGLNG